ncbi:restriction endonuclease subunit S [Veillonella parvula]|uniref:restriction endonuclease subunit S n=1 Tax=Veillonella parvula TaxID=29466 RepID=UPI001896E0BC|nr:restriction endonuclease subunit S [Veillonella parvula]
MSKEKRRVPKLRFPGFTEDWEQRKFGELFILKSGVAFKLSEYTKTGIPIINGESIKAGKISLEKINYLPNEYQYKYQECLLFPGDIVLGLNRPIIDGTLKISRIPADIKKSLLYQRAGKIIFKVNMDENFTYQLLSKEVLTFTKKEAVGSDQPFITTTKLNKWDLYFPVKDKERRNIGSLFNNIDNIITLHQRKLNNLKLKKKALLQKLFPKNGERYPELRFPGFTDAWEQRKFSDITYLSGIKNKENKPYESYSISNEFGFIPQDEQFENGGTMKTADKSMYYIVSQNSFAYNPARINVGSIGYYDKPNNVIVSSLYEVFKTIDIVNDKFLWHWFKSNQFNRLIEKYQEGGVRLYFYYDKLCKGTIDLPTINEQNKISNLLDRLDLYITLHQRKLDHLQLQKKALLQQMFV